MNLYYSILRRCHDFDEMSRQGSSPTKHELLSFLDSITDAANLIEDTRELGYVLVIYRKWEALLFRTFGLQHISKPIVSRRVANPEFTNPDSVKGVGEVIYDQSQAPIELLKAFSRGIDPYSSFYKKGLAAIDSSFLEKHDSLNLLVKATESFKKSDLSDSKRTFNKVVDRYRAEAQLSATQLYFYSWALHGLGNIYLVLDEVDIAFRLFSLSLEIKEKIPEIPPLFSYVTRLKVITASGGRGNTRDWNSELKTFIRTVSNDRSRCEVENHKLYKNIFADAFFALGQSHIFLCEDVDAKIALQRSGRFSNEVRDLSGLLRAEVARGILSQRPVRHVRHIETILAKFSKKDLSDPYVQQLGGVHSSVKIEMLAERFHSELFQVFRAHGIKGHSEGDIILESDVI